MHEKIIVSLVDDKQNSTSHLTLLAAASNSFLKVLQLLTFHILPSLSVHDKKKIPRNFCFTLFYLVSHTLVVYKYEPYLRYFLKQPRSNYLKNHLVNFLPNVESNGRFDRYIWIGKKRGRSSFSQIHTHKP
jgi:hypothetical protein